VWECLVFNGNFGPTETLVVSTTKYIGGFVVNALVVRSVIELLGHGGVLEQVYEPRNEREVLESAPRATSRISTGFAERTDVAICVGVGVAAAGVGATVILHWSDAREEGDLCSKALTRGKVGELGKARPSLLYARAPRSVSTL
jgi:hypothetical protein